MGPMNLGIDLNSAREKKGYGRADPAPRDRQAAVAVPQVLRLRAAPDAGYSMLFIV